MTDSIFCGMMPTIKNEKEVFMMKVIVFLNG